MTDTEQRPSGETSSRERSPFAPPQLELPKGGGAIRGMGEKFSVDAARGTASLTVPIAISEARSGFTPQLSVHYDSGTGNGEFGMGWGLFLPAITRKQKRVCRGTRMLPSRMFSCYREPKIWFRRCDTSAISGWLKNGNGAATASSATGLVSKAYLRASRDGPESK